MNIVTVLLNGPKSPSMNCVVQTRLSECGAENALFWKRVSDYKAMFKRGGSTPSADIDDAARSIFVDFIDPESAVMMEVNLPWSDRRELLRLFESDEAAGFESDVFDDAVNSVLRMLQADSLARFKRAHRDVWNRFQEKQKESKALLLMSNAPAAGAASTTSILTAGVAASTNTFRSTIGPN